MKVIDITEKLNFEEKPRIKIRDVEITINNSAANMLEIMSVINKKNSDMNKAISLLVPEDEIDKLKGLDLTYEDFTTFIESAIELVTGTGDKGEAQTRTTT